MKCFVSGGAGFIGSHLVDSLIQQGHSVTIYDNFSSGKLEFIEHHLKDPLSSTSRAIYSILKL